MEDRRTFKASQSASGKASRHVLDSLRNDEEEPELIQQWREDPDDISHREGELLNAWQGLLDRLSTAQATVSRLQAEHFNSERAQKALVSLGETVTRLSGENEQLRAALAEKVAECNDIKGIVDAWVQHDAKAAGPCKGCGNPPSQCACFPTDEQVGANRR